MEGIYWKEGILLRQQHLQLCDEVRRKHERNIYKCINKYNFGFKKYSINHENLDHSVLSIYNIEGIFKNGIYFFEPDEVNLNIENCKSQDTIYLCLSSNNKIEHNSNYERYKVVNLEVNDIHSLQDDTELQVLKYNLYLTNIKPTDGSVYLPIVKIESVEINQGALISKTYEPPKISMASVIEIRVLIENFKSIVNNKLLTLSSNVVEQLKTNKKYRLHSFKTILNCMLFKLNDIASAHP